MNDDLIADIWTVLVEHILEKHRSDAATEYVNALLDHGVKESAVTDMLGIDPYLDVAIRYAVDGEESEIDDEDDYYEDEYEN